MFFFEFSASFFENQSPVDDDRCPMEALMDLHDESKPIIKQEIKQEPIRVSLILIAVLNQS